MFTARRPEVNDHFVGGGDADRVGIGGVRRDGGPDNICGGSVYPTEQYCVIIHSAGDGMKPFGQRSIARCIDMDFVTGSESVISEGGS